MLLLFLILGRIITNDANNFTDDLFHDKIFPEGCTDQ